MVARKPVRIREYLASNPVMRRIQAALEEGDTLWSAYEVAAGEALHGHTQALAMDSEVLVVSLDSSQAMAEARLREPAILSAVSHAVGRPVARLRVRLAA